jgi:hypothetical protein
VSPGIWGPVSSLDIAAELYERVMTRRIAPSRGIPELNVIVVAVASTGGSSLHQLARELIGEGWRVRSTATIVRRRALSVLGRR